MATLITLNSFSLELKITPTEFDLPVFSKKERVTLKSLNNKKTLINFWATWCTSCIQEMPELHHLMDSDKKGEYNFIAISAGDTKRKIKKFVKKHGFRYKILMDKSREVSKKWGIDSLPITVILDKNRKVIFKGIRPPKSLL